MRLAITCPECNKVSETDWDKVPEGKLKTRCNTCGAHFSVDKKNKLNCRKVFDPPPKVEGEFEEDGWNVEHPVCKGIKYDLTALGGLIRSGLISPTTLVLPPKGKGFKAAQEIEQLQKFFDQKEKADSRAH